MNIILSNTEWKKRKNHKQTNTNLMNDKQINSKYTIIDTRWIESVLFFEKKCSNKDTTMFQTLYGETCVFGFFLILLLDGFLISKFLFSFPFFSITFWFIFCLFVSLIVFFCYCTICILVGNWLYLVIKCIDCIYDIDNHQHGQQQKWTMNDDVE